MMARRNALDGAKVLLVEDAKDIRDVFSLLLEAEGAEVVATGSGREAAELGAEGNFYVVLTDLGLPDIPGDMVIRHVIGTARRRPRIVVVTGYEEPFISRARAAGADVVLTKPIAWSALIDRLAPATSVAA
jgi:two-component system, chemotaxis family, CheB/CheR fusion protein